MNFVDIYEMSYLRFEKEPLANKFTNLVDVIFGVLLAQGLLLYKENILNAFSVDYLSENLAILAVYVIILFSWYGYHNSIIRFPYNRTFWSRIRLTLDLSILIVYAYMLYGLKDSYRLLLGSAIVFLLYLITGLVRIKEWKDGRVSKWELNLSFFVSFLVMYFFFEHTTFMVNSYLKSIVIPILTIVAVVSYRILRYRAGYPFLLLIGVDVDGVLGEQVPHVLKWLKEKKKVNHNVTYEDITSWKAPISENITIDMDIEEALLDSEFVETMPVVLGSEKTMKKMYEKYHIIITSSRPRESEEATKRWLKKHFKYHEYVNTRDVGKHNIGLDILIDDNLENIRLFCKNYGKLGIIFDRPWNQSSDVELEKFVNSGLVVRCKKWEEIYDTINRLSYHTNPTRKLS
ncbi:MAG: hypothetical protein N3G77_01130 [Nitrososphaeria archaeon]|nr:hypothetical protein [Nitrososphaeria archaeon]